MCPFRPLVCVLSSFVHQKYGLLCVKKDELQFCGKSLKNLKKTMHIYKILNKLTKIIRHTFHCTGWSAARMNTEGFLVQTLAAL
uniref:Uncharacterized protein n=1 Tax=Anguilla anguilla TaxID=7936 RepID=A0A0E9TZC2_ANGAN